MAENSKIEWTDHTFNPWVGCTKVSPACDNCYAERWAKRTGNAGLWNGERRRTSDANWRKPLKWNRQAAEIGVRYRVFCASLADVFDNAVPDQWRADLFSLIDSTPNLDWLLLTKRIGNAIDMGIGVRPRANVWLGATVVNQREFDRDVPKLHSVPAAVRFLSMEPLTEAVDVEPEGLDWIIVGGESGPNARPLEKSWAQRIRNRCFNRDVAFFMKQGSQANWPDWKDFGHWPESLRVRQFPRPGYSENHGQDA